MTDLAQRYGSPSRARRLGLVLLGVVLAVGGLAWLLWAGLSQSNPLVQSELLSFNAPKEHSASARITVVRRDSTVVASCVLQATATDHSVVGELDFTVGPGAPTSVTLTKVMRTERQATAVDLLGCTAPGQKRPQ